MMNLRNPSLRTLPLFVVLCAFAACSGGGGDPSQSIGGGSQNLASGGAKATPSARPSAAPSSSASPGATAPPANSAIVAPPGFTVSVVANVGGARELSFVPNGDLLVGTGGGSVAIVPNADAPGVAGMPGTFANVGDNPVAGVAYANGYVYVSTQHSLLRTPYRSGDQSAEALSQIAAYRQGPIAPNSDGDVHISASVAVTSTNAFIGIGSSCNACREVDPTRASVQETALDGSGMTTYATRFRNAIALAVNPSSGTVWAGGAGQDALPLGHPYEFIDALTSHAPVADYGWPDCEENQHAYTPGANCSNTVIPRVEFPAYSTLIGATFYPPAQAGPHAFPSAYRGGLFVAAHGSWHVINGHHVAPHVAFVPMNGDVPVKPVNWNDPTAQWSEFLSGFQNDANNDARIGRPTGIAVGPQGSLFVADDQSGNIYRVRPSTAGG
ncbi:MAG: hypothetical protein M3R44_00950 [Candidatus Eremiobacteraeota bacterium]|nr:hypothetical protein [Candidatus Eremiobacteraeota bacterium]